MGEATPAVRKGNGAGRQLAEGEAEAVHNSIGPLSPMRLLWRRCGTASEVATIATAGYWLGQGTLRSIDFFWMYAGILDRVPSAFSLDRHL